MLLCVHLEKINWKIDSMRQPNRRFGFSISVWTLPTAVHYNFFFSLYSLLTTFHHSVTDLDVKTKCPQRSLNGLWSFPISLVGLCTTSSPLCLSVPSRSLCSIKGRSHWCRYWPLRGAAVQVAALARRCCGQTQTTNIRVSGHTAPVQRPSGSDPLYCWMPYRHHHRNGQENTQGHICSGRAVKLAGNVF